MIFNACLNFDRVIHIIFLAGFNIWKRSCRIQFRTHNCGQLNCINDVFRYMMQLRLLQNFVGVLVNYVERHLNNSEDKSHCIWKLYVDRYTKRLVFISNVNENIELTKTCMHSRVVGGSTVQYCTYSNVVVLEKKAIEEPGHCTYG